MTLPAFDVFSPGSLQEALAFLRDNSGRTKIIAGGTDLVPSMKQKLFEPDYLLDIKSLRELEGIREQPDGGLRIGALTTITDIARNPILMQNFPALQQAALTVAGPNLRNVGTLGGNVCLDTRCYWYNQSFFWRQSCGFCIKKDGTVCHVAPGSKTCWAVYSGDTAAALLTMDAELRIVSSDHERLIPIGDFFYNDGKIKHGLAQDEILAEVLVPASARGYDALYQKFRLRGSVDYPLAGAAISVKRINGEVQDLRIALTAVNPMPVMVKGVWDAYNSQSREEIGKLAMRTAKPLKTSASTMDYRRHMIGVIVRRSLEKLGV